MKSKDAFTIALGTACLTHPNYYGKGRNVPIFETREEAQKEIDTYYPRTILRVKKIKVLVFED